jgi:hypothetical protein
MSTAESVDHVMKSVDVGEEFELPAFTEGRDDSAQSLPSVDNGTESTVSMIPLF